MSSAWAFSLLALLVAPSAAVAAPQASWPLPDARGLHEVSGLLHIHSPYSHDACDGHGLTEEGLPDPQCLEDLRRSVCEVPRRFYFWTDHPSFMAEQPFEDLFLFDPARGDVLVRDPQSGDIVANAILCSDGVSSWTTWMYVGSESSHNMPIGLEDHLEDTSLYSVGLGTGEDINQQLESIEAIHAVDGLALMAHAEEDDVTAERIIAEGLDALELYNAHSNINVILNRYIGQLLQLEYWIEGAENPPESDYVALLMYPYMDMTPFTRWDEVTPTMAMPGVIGTDVHQNVTLDPYCLIEGVDRLCARLEPKYPNLVAYLSVGGPIPMADGTRLDSYTRMFRWFANHARMPQVDPFVIRDTVASGLEYISYDILGVPVNFDFVGRTSTGTFLEMGETATSSAGLTLHVALPQLAPTDIRGEDWTLDELSAAEITGVLKKVDASGSKVVGRLSSGRPTLDYAVSGAGVYRVEVSIRPHHLVRELGSQEQYAHDQYLWIVSNPIYVRDNGKIGGSKGSAKASGRRAGEERNRAERRK